MNQPRLKISLGLIALAALAIDSGTSNSIHAQAPASRAPRASTGAAPTPARVEVELATEPGISPSVPQQWYQTFTELRVTGLRIRGAENADEPTIDTAGTTAAPVYKVTGIVDRHGDLLLPGGKFRAADRAALSDWLAKLRREGPERAKGGPRLPYGFTKAQFAAAYEDLSRPISTSTKGIGLRELIDRAADTLKYPLRGESAAAARLGDAAPLDAELRGLSMGTALAYALDSVGLALVPRLDARREPTYMIVPQTAKQERWPVGWPPQGPRRDVLPPLFDTVDVEIDDVPLARVLEAVAEHVAAPLLVDQAALAGEKVDLAATKVSLPAKRSMYDIVLRKTLVPKRITHELRVDEADRPFLWITSTRKAAELSAKAKETPR